MNALSKLLAKVAIRAISKSTTESELLTVGDKVISWQPLILEEHIAAIADSMEEIVNDVEIPEEELVEDDVISEIAEGA